MDKLPPAVTVTNIKSHIPVVLENDCSKYNSWKQLFLTHCEAYEGLDHIVPPDNPPEAKPPTWDRVDALVRQWIYSTISPELLETILKPKSTAQMAWDTLAALFQDNENSRTVDLENKFSSTRMDSFTDISSYCKAMKNIADQLANVNAPVSDKRLVLQIVKGLNSKYNTVAAIIQQTTPLPDFYGVRSRLTMEESRLNAQENTPADTALAAAAPPPPAAPAFLSLNPYLTFMLLPLFPFPKTPPKPLPYPSGNMP
ncbi:uncharacterized protein LOC110931276 [Helianthus annuus]|uniref:uncharacterized protein LOC110931276 n=1 Tax=Helianthus annuus TaxID=4232 RepID=UPI000B9029EE|nr:uncharacterized protein LOC110931276 [Helianthus annuus]